MQGTSNFFKCCEANSQLSESILRSTRRGAAGSAYNLSQKWERATRVSGTAQEVQAIRADVSARSIENELCSAESPTARI
jgi:hypothetical protein